MGGPTEPLRPQDEELASPEAQAGVRSDLGMSSTPAAAETETEPDAKGPRGSGEDAGRGTLGSLTPGSAGSPESDEG